MANNKKTRSIQVCFSPALFHLYEDIESSIVVVIDILRASSTICVALDKGVEKIIPVSTVEQSHAYITKANSIYKNGFIAAAERHGKKVDGFEYGNSPLEIINNGDFKGKNLVFTTTNGTHAIMLAKNAYKVVIGSFLNLKVLVNWISEQDKNVICLCAGWKNKFNLEDALFAGAVVNNLKNDFYEFCDGAIAAEKLYLSANNDMVKFLKNSSHYKRLAGLGIEEDIKFCLTKNRVDVIPVLNGECLVKMSATSETVNSDSEFQKIKHV